jgi:hypothetical protein
MIVSHWPTTMIGLGGEEINSLALHTLHFSGLWVGEKTTEGTLDVLNTTDRGLRWA